MRSPQLTLRGFSVVLSMLLDAALRTIIHREFTLGDQHRGMRCSMQRQLSEGYKVLRGMLDGPTGKTAPDGNIEKWLYLK